MSRRVSPAVLQMDFNMKRALKSQQDSLCSYKQLQAATGNLRVKMFALLLQHFCAYQQLKMVKHNEAIKVALFSKQYVFTLTSL